METRHLKYFVAVAEELHFGKAAKRLHISQPPLSQQIMKFEEELGVPLFLRDRRSVRLTAAGESLLKDARSILGSMEQARRNLSAAAGGERGRLSLGYIGPALNTALPEVIRRFRGTYPNVRFDLQQMGTNEQLDALRAETIDAGVVRLFRHQTDGLETMLFHQEAYAVVVPEDHPLAERDSVDLSEIEGEPLITFPRSVHPPLYDEWMRIFASHGFMPDIVQEVETKNAAQALAAAGMGIAIVPESLSSEARRGVRFLTLNGKYPTLEIHVVTRRGDISPATRNLLKIVREIMRATMREAGRENRL